MKKLRFVLISFAAIIFVAAILLFTRKMTIPFAYSSKAGGSWSVGMVMSDNPLDIDVNNITWHPYGKYIQHPSTGIFADPFVVEDIISTCIILAKTSKNPSAITTIVLMFFNAGYDEQEISKRVGRLL